MEEEKGVWRTVSGRRIFIREGQSLTDAMRDSGKFGKYSDIPAVRLDPKEYGYVMHNINTYYRKFKGQRICSIQLNSLDESTYYEYVFIKNKFNSYKIILRLEYNEELMNATKGD